MAEETWGAYLARLDREATAGLKEALRYYLGPTGIPDKLNVLAPVAASMLPGVGEGMDMQDAANASSRLWAEPSLPNALALVPPTVAMAVPGISNRLVQGLGDVGGDIAATARRFPGDEFGGVRLWHGTKDKGIENLSLDDAGRDYLWLSNDKGYSEGVAGRTNLSKRNEGSLFEVDADIRNPFVVDIEKEARAMAEYLGVDPTDGQAAEEAFRGGMNYETLVDLYEPDVRAGGHDALVFKNTWDGFDRQTDQYVVFDDSLINILAKYGIAPGMFGGLNTLAGYDEQQ